MEHEEPTEPVSETDASDSDVYAPPEREETDENGKPIVSDGQAAYNVFSDTVTGINVRGSDNKFQAIFVMVSVLICAGIMIVLSLINSDWDLPWFAAALVGVFAGLLIGVFLSGIYLMIYRAKRHLDGKHD